MAARPRLSSPMSLCRVGTAAITPGIAAIDQEMPKNDQRGAVALGIADIDPEIAGITPGE
jgi:hypothetical protein